MSLIINNNLMAANTARHLNESYGALGKSVQRLSSGLRVNSAADDAAGLAIREMMRADIAALNQGVRNVNDAISMTQTADGAMGIIDEKLIRMKELAEQAATGTYSSDQRLMIDSEYQEMAKEISRIANSTTFNGTHLLNGDLESDYHDGSSLQSTGKAKIHFGPNNSSDSDYYYVTIPDCTAEALSLGNGASFDTSVDKLADHVKNTFEATFRPLVDSGDLSQQDYDALVEEAIRIIPGDLDYFGSPTELPGFTLGYREVFGGYSDTRDETFTPTYFPNEEYGLTPLEGTTDQELFDSYNALNQDEKERYNYLFGRNRAQGWSWWHTNNPDDINTHGPWYNYPFPDDEIKLKTAKATAECYDWYVERHTYAGKNIETQENAQMALEAINRAITVKDKARAHLGAMQNRLENTASNLMIQAENLQASESRISDVDVATEMTSFVRSQILTQSATAMLSQANSLPQMALQVIQG